MKSRRPRARKRIKDKFLAIFVEPVQVPAAATFRGAIGSGWPATLREPGNRALVDLWLEQHQPREVAELGRN